MSLTNQPNPDKLQFAFNPSTYTDQLVLVGGTAQTYSLTAAQANFGTNALCINVQGENASIAVNFNGSAASFAGSSTSNGAAAAINPGVRYVGNINSISVISRTGQNVSIEVWAA